MLELNFRLLSDWNGEATRGFGVENEWAGLAGVAERTAFLVGTDGIVRDAWQYGADEVPDVDALIEAARALE